MYKKKRNYRAIFSIFVILLRAIFRIIVIRIALEGNGHKPPGQKSPGQKTPRTKAPPGQKTPGKKCPAATYSIAAVAGN